MKLACHYGDVEVGVGDQFDTGLYLLFPQGRWRVDSFTPHRIYSPNGLGGTLVLVCTHLATGEQKDVCGDSVASMLHDTRHPGLTYAERKALLYENDPTGLPGSK